MLIKKILLVLFVLVALGLFFWWAKKEPAITLAPASSFSSQTVTLGAVTIEVRPEKLGKDEGENIFKVTLDTHSGDLDFEFAKMMILEDNLGNRYQAEKWTGGSGGHHLTGEIIFPSLKKEAKEVVLKISEIDGEEGSLTWEL